MSANYTPTALKNTSLAPGSDSVEIEPGSDEPSSLVGQLVDGKYKITAILGSGAMAVVLAARHVFLDKDVAIKVLHPAVLAVPGVRERFLREARATSGIAHERVVAVTDSGVMDQGFHYLVMEKLTGKTLFEWSEGNLPLAPDHAAVVGAMVADGLSAIHAAGFVHRDIKPENLFVVDGPDGAPSVKILDLGVAGLLRDAAPLRPADRLTRADSTVGTVYYMAPEQATASQIDGRTDLYALGCVLWELLTGSLLFEADTQHGVLMHHLSTTPDAPSVHSPAVPAWLDDIVLRCLAKHPDDRFPNAAALRDALLAPLLSAHTTGGYPAVGEADLTIPPRRRVWPLFLGGAVLLAAMVVFFFEPWRKDDVTDGELRGAVAVAAEPTPEAPANPEPAPVNSEPAPGNPPERPEPAPVAPTASKVTVTFDIQPAGAEIRRNDAVIGRAPLTVELEPSEASVRYAVAAPGHIPLALEFDSETTRTIRRALEPLPTASDNPTPVATSTEPDRDGTPRIRPKRPPRPSVTEPPVDSSPGGTTTQPPSELWRPKRPETTP